MKSTESYTQRWTLSKNSRYNNSRTQTSFPLERAFLYVRRCSLGLRPCPQRSDENQNESHLQPNQTTIILLQSRCARAILAKLLNISPHQLSYVTHSGEGEGLIVYGDTILPFLDHFNKESRLYQVMTTKPGEMEYKSETR